MLLKVNLWIKYSFLPLGTISLNARIQSEGKCHNAIML